MIIESVMRFEQSGRVEVFLGKPGCVRWVLLAYIEKQSRDKYKYKYVEITVVESTFVKGDRRITFKHARGRSMAIKCYKIVSIQKVSGALVTMKFPPLVSDAKQD